MENGRIEPLRAQLSPGKMYIYANLRLLQAGLGASRTGVGATHFGLAWKLAGSLGVLEAAGGPWRPLEALEAFGGPPAPGPRTRVTLVTRVTLATRVTRVTPVTRVTRARAFIGGN